MIREIFIKERSRCCSRHLDDHGLLRQEDLNSIETANTETEFTAEQLKACFEAFRDRDMHFSSLFGPFFKSNGLRHKHVFIVNGFVERRIHFRSQRA